MVDQSTNHRTATSSDQQRNNLYVRCGLSLQPGIHRGTSILYPFERMKGCQFRAVWGPYSVGLCQHFPGRPCIYTGVFRDPIERMIRTYEEDCVHATFKSATLWPHDWRVAGRCTVSITEFAMKVKLVSLVQLLTRTCDRDCGLHVADTNVKHPCFRYLLHEKLQDGLDKLASAFPASFGSIMPSAPPHKNITDTQLSGRTKVQVDDINVMRNLTFILRDDVQVYRTLVNNYDSSWSRPIESCNEF